MLTLIYAGLVEYVMMVSEALGTLLFASGTAVAVVAFHLFDDLPSRLYVALCVFIGLATLAIIKHEAERH
jgi:cytochrome c biogenesis factor